MNKRVHKHLNAADDLIATAKHEIGKANFKAGAVLLQKAANECNLAAAEHGKAQAKHESSRFVQNTKEPSCR